MAKPQHSSSHFEYSLYSTDDDSIENTPIPLNSLICKETGNTIYYVDSSPECYTFKLTNKKPINDKLLINFKLSFGAEKFGQRELATINQWKAWHGTNLDNSYANQEFEFITINPEDDSDTIQDLSDKDLLNLKTFLWDATAQKPTQTECEFFITFGCHSNQFPIKLNSAEYTGSVFMLSINIFSVSSKQKLDSFELILKISRKNLSLFKEDSGMDLTLKSELNFDSVEANLQELLSKLHSQPIAKETNDARLPTYDQLKTVKLNYGLFSYRLPNLCSNVNDYNSKPTALVTRNNFDFEIQNLHFEQFYGKNELIKTIITLETRNASWFPNWQHLNPNKSLLKGYFEGNEFFDVYTPGKAELALIWSPTINAHLLTVTITDLKQLQGKTLNMKVESFLVENGTKVDEAQCQINFLDDKSHSMSYNAQYKSTTLINDGNFLIEKAFFLSIDGNEYKPLVFQKSFCSKFNVDQFKADLCSFIRKVKNIDSNIEIREIKYFETESQHKNQKEQGEIFEAKIFKQLKVKTILKCILRKDDQAKSELVQYDIDFINQDENYLNAYI